MRTCVAGGRNSCVYRCVSQAVSWRAEAVTLRRVHAVCNKGDDSLLWE